MDEQKKEELEEQKTDAGKGGRKDGTVPGRSLMLMLLAGLYLVYTGYTLCKNVLDGAEGSGWGFFAAGAIFIVFGAGMLIQALKGYNARARADREAQAEEETPEEEPLPTPEQQEKTPKMSISERARLVNSSEEEDDAEEEELS